MKKKVIKMMLSLFMASILFAGCGGSGNSDISEKGIEESNKENNGDNSNTGAPDTGVEVSSTVVWASNASLPNLDKFGQTGSIASKIGKLWGDSLVESDRKGGYEGLLATEIVFAEDSMSVDITLREDVLFTNGEPLSAEDVQFTMDRIKALDTWNASKWSKFLDHVEVIDETHCTIYFSALMPTFYVEASSCPILNKDAFDSMGEEAFWKNPVGVGAYAVSEFDELSGDVTLTRNDDWFGWEYYDKKSNVDTIRFQGIIEDTTRISSLRAGEVSIIEYVPNDSVELLESEGFTTVSTPSYEHVYLGVNVAEGRVFNDYNLRLALSECIDRQLLCDSVLGAGTAANWGCNPGTMGYNSETSFTYDVDHAKKLVEESGYDGSEINFVVNTATITRGSEVAQAIQSMCGAIGLNVSVDMLENATFDEARSAGNYDMALAIMGTNLEDNNMEIAEVIGGDRFCTGFDNDELKEVCSTAMQYVDIETRADYYKRAYQIVFDNLYPNIPLYYTESCIAYAGNVTNIESFTGGGYEMRFIVVE